MELAGFDAALARESGADCIIGVDEVGRGPLAGPVVACACWIPPESAALLKGVDDSKKLSPARREKLFELIRESGARYSAAFVSSAEVDRINILNATFMAMKAAIAGINPGALSLIAVDGNQLIPGLAFRQKAIVQGDGKSQAIAAASIVAKVLRDRRMQYLDFKHPGYLFAGHKGYGSAQHYERLRELGPCPEHRMTFLKNFLAENEPAR